MKGKVHVAIISSLITLIVCLLIGGILFVSVFLVGFTDENDFGTIIGEIDRYIDSVAIFDFDKDVAVENMIRQYLYAGLKDDKYCEYFTAEELSEFYDDNSGNFTGIGVQVLNEESMSEGLFIYRVLGNSPAQDAGLKVGDRIVKVDDTDIRDMTYAGAVDVILQEEGTASNLTVVRNTDGIPEEIIFPIVYTKFSRIDLEYEIMDSIGYVRIYEFSNNTETQFNTAMQALIDADVKGIVFDVRNNPGGMLDVVVAMIDSLVPKDETIVILKSKNDEQITDSRIDPVTDVPMVVLMNKSSASASELFASSLRDINGALLIGTESFGKQIGQTTYPLSSGGGVKMTTFHYFTKSRTDYNGKGLVPDVEISLSEEKENYFYALDIGTEDEQFAKAREVINNLINGGND